MVETALGMTPASESGQSAATVSCQHTINKKPPSRRLRLLTNPSIFSAGLFFGRWLF